MGKPSETEESTHGNLKEIGMYSTQPRFEEGWGTHLKNLDKQKTKQRKKKGGGKVAICACGTWDFKGDFQCLYKELSSFF